MDILLTTNEITTTERDEADLTDVVVTEIVTDDEPVEDDTTTFAELGVLPEICAALADVGITHTFPMQTMSIPIALAGTDLIGQARTGTG